VIHRDFLPDRFRFPFFDLDDAPMERSASIILVPCFVQTTFGSDLEFGNDLGRDQKKTRGRNVPGTRYPFQTALPIY
jgi:hypothetical protein